MDSTRIKKIASFLVTTFTIYYILQSLVGQRFLTWYAKYELYSKIEANDPDFVKLEVAYNFNDIGYLMNKEGKYEGALELYEISLAIFKKLYDDDANKDITETLKNLGSVCSELERFDDAIIYFKQLLHAYRQIYESDENESVFETMQSLGINYLRSGKTLEATEYLKEAKSIFYKLYTEDDPKYIEILLHLEQFVVHADILLKQEMNKKQEMNQKPEPTDL